MSRDKFYLIGNERERIKFFEPIHQAILEQLFLRAPHMEAYQNELEVITRAKGQEFMVLPGQQRQIKVDHLYLNVEMSGDWPILGIAPGAHFQYKAYFQSMAIHDRYQTEPDFRPKAIRQLMGYPK